METIPITPDRKAQLEAYAQRHGQDTAAALDSVREDYLAWDAEDHEEMLASLREGLEEVFEELRVKYGFPR